MTDFTPGEMLILSLCVGDFNIAEKEVRFVEYKNKKKKITSIVEIRTPTEVENRIVRTSKLKRKE